MAPHVSPEQTSERRLSPEMRKQQYQSVSAGQPEGLHNDGRLGAMESLYELVVHLLSNGAQDGNHVHGEQPQSSHKPRVPGRGSSYPACGYTAAPAA
mmetsp:Transcript_12191/g.16510  ORF Transcript_12191/g.16510 Transcript_12191/m.16510 type:complete len:97 (-) Transcript_12191:312-602(-)